MAKIINTAARVIGAVASIAALIPGPWQPIAVAVAAVASITVAITAQMIKPKSANNGSQTSFKADPWAGIPLWLGMTLVGGNIVYWEPHGDDNKYQSLAVVLSGAGPIESIDQTSMDKEPITFSGGITGVYQIDGHDRVWQDVQLGECPEAAALSPGIGSPPGWTADSKISGMAAVMLTMEFDAKGDNTLTSTPRMGWKGKGIKVYDPRQDSTYPGGSGPCRALNESTYVWTGVDPDFPAGQNPFLHGLTYALGRWQNGKRVAGVGMPIDQIDVANFVEGANVCDANGWKLGGQVSTADDKWNALKLMLRAGGGEPIRYGARLSCIVNTPRVVLDTIDYKQIIGRASIPSMQGRRERINGIVPSYRSEDHGWEVVAAGLVRNSVYLAEDGTERTEEITFDLVQAYEGDTPDQAAQLAGYHIANSREAQPIVLPLKPRWIGYRIGDCLACDAEEANLAGRQLIITGRQFDVQAGSVTLTLKTEDPDKHDWALGLVGEPAPLPNAISRPAITTPAGWTMEAISLTGDGTSMPALRFSGTASNVATSILFEYAPGTTTPGDGDWIGPAVVDTRDGVITWDTTSLLAGTSYMGAVSYRVGERLSPRLILGPVTTPLPGTGVGRLLLEDGGRLLLESGDQLLLG